MEIKDIWKTLEIWTKVTNKLNIKIIHRKHSSKNIHQRTFTENIHQIFTKQCTFNTPTKPTSGPIISTKKHLNISTNKYLNISTEKYNDLVNQNLDEKFLSQKGSASKRNCTSGKGVWPVRIDTLKLPYHPFPLFFSTRVRTTWSKKQM